MGYYMPDNTSKKPYVPEHKFTLENTSFPVLPRLKNDIFTFLKLGLS
jgi:hypothetical protein